MTFGSSGYEVSKLTRKNLRKFTIVEGQNLNKLSLGEQDYYISKLAQNYLGKSKQLSIKTRTK
jgi:hypothetical protein